jgi:uncharacterized membrane protein
VLTKKCGKEQKSMINPDSEEKEVELSPQKIVKGTAKGCLKAIIVIVCIIVILVIILVLFPQMGKSGLLITQLVLLAYFIFGLLCLLYLIPRRIYRQSRKSNSLIRAIASILLGLFITFIWWVVSYATDPSGILPGARLGDLLRGGTIFLVGSVIEIVIWFFLEPKNEK